MRGGLSENVGKLFHLHCEKGGYSIKRQGLIITGCLKPTAIDNVQILSRIMPPEIRRNIEAYIERVKQIHV